MGRLLLLLLAVLAASQQLSETQLFDGKSHRGFIDSLTGGESRYLFEFIGDVGSEKDLTATLTTFSDSAHSVLYVSKSKTLTASEYQWSSGSWGSGSVVIPSSELSGNATLHLLVVCAEQCHYTLTVEHTQETEIAVGAPVSGFLREDRDRVYVFRSGKSRATHLTLTVTPKGTNSHFILSAMANETYMRVRQSWHIGQSCEISPVVAATEYRFTVTAPLALYYTVVLAAPDEPQELQAAVPTPGEVRMGETAVFAVNVTSSLETLVVQLSTYVGDADMYIRAGSPPTSLQSDFSSPHFGNSTISITRPQRELLRFPTGLYYIAIVPYSHSVFLITASLSRSRFIALFPGVPQVGFADPGEVDQYYLDVPREKDLNVTVRVAAIYGNPDLAVRLCNEEKRDDCAFTADMVRHPSRFNISYSKHKTGDESVLIQHSADLCKAARCRYVAAVSGASQTHTRFTVSGDFDDSVEYRLMEGVPVKKSLRGKSYTYFKYSVFNETVSSLTFQLTAISGNPDLFVSTIHEKPSQVNYDKASLNSIAASESVSYERGTDSESLIGTYHATVYSELPTVFSLVALEKVPGRNSTLALVSGQSQEDMLYNYTDLGYRLYSLQVNFPQGNEEEIRVTVTPISGSFVVYAANRVGNMDWEKDVFYYMWFSNDTSSSMQSASLTISPSDPDYLRQATYLVLVFATSFTADQTATYIITASSGSGFISLQEGVPFPDELATGKYRYYAFPIRYDHEDLTITVSALAGDPDVYISLRTNNTRPDKDNYDKRSTSFGGEVISLQWEEGIRDLCPHLPTEYHFGDPLYCLMHISVYGYKSAVYTITVTASKEVPSLLSLQTPAVGQLQKAEYRYYYTLLSSSLPLTASLVSMTGDGDLFVNLFDAQGAGMDSALWERPNHNKANYKSQSAAQLDRIDLSVDVLTAKCDSGVCLALIGVYCFSATQCSYSLSVTQEDAQTLAEGQSQIGKVDAMKYDYYSFYNDKDSTSMLITLTAVSGDPDLYVSKGRYARPSSDNFDWSSRGWRGESLLISAADAHFNSTHSMRGHYGIAVKGASNSTYVLSVLTDSSQAHLILSGVPIHGTVSSNSAIYYEYLHAENSSLSVRLTPLDNSASLRVTPAGLVASHLPAKQEFLWSSEATGAENYINVDTSDVNFCSSCAYIIAVFAGDRDCSFVLTVSAGDGTVMLVNGVPRQDTVGVGQWRLYHFYNPVDSDVDASLTNYAGDADLYVSTTDTVSSTDFNWTCSTSRHVEHIHIPKKDQLPSQQLYLIGVYGVRNTSYSITAHSRDSSITLIDGWPHTYNIMLRASDHLIFDYPISGYYFIPVQCILRPLTSDFWPHVVTLFTTTRDRFPSLLDHDKEYSTSDYDAMYRTLTIPMIGNGTQGLYRIGVFGTSVHGVSRDELGAFEISCSSQARAEVLRAGAVVAGSIPPLAKELQYSIFVPDVAVLEAILVPCAGRVSLGIASNYTSAQGSEPEALIMRENDGRLVGTIARALGQYYITVKSIALASSAEFELSVELVSLTEKRPPKPIAGNDGLLTWSVRHHSQIALHWSPPELESGAPITAPADYFIYATKNLEQKMNSVCVIRAAQKREEVWVVKAVEAGKDEGVPVIVELPAGETMLVNVVARLQLQTNILLTTVVYQPTEVYLRARGVGRRFSNLLMGLVSAAFMLSLFALFCYYKKYKHVKKRLENEMMDIRSVASVSSDVVDAESLGTESSRRGVAYVPFELAK